MKKRPTTEVKPSALIALKSHIIIAANSHTVQQATLLVLVLILITGGLAQ